jgi:hypothetical protein
MKQLLFFLTALLGQFSLIQAQTTILDFEEPATSTTFQYFGSSIDGSTNAIIANPNPSGINTSSMVAEFIKPANSQVWAGAFSNPDPSIPIDVTVGSNQICIKVHRDRIGSLSLKLENSSTGGANWIQTVPNTTTGEWEELCFDVSLPSLEGPFEPAAGHVYSRVVLFFDFGSSSDEDVTSYFDDLVVMPAPVACTTILDFEEAATSTNFQYFGSSIDGSTNAIIANPNPSGINTSSMVAEFIKPANSQVWAGAFSNPDPSTPMDLTVDGTQICIKVHRDRIGSLSLKLENSSTGGANWIQTVPNTTTGEWEELCFDVSLPSLEGPFEPAAGHVYSRVVLFFDFGSSSDEDVTSYFDDLVVCSGGASGPVDVSFAVDMSGYDGSFGQVYISGTFNGWSADANPLEDTDGDGIWTTTLQLMPGVIEYKFQVDGWANQEQFIGTETCTVTDPSGQFINRQLVVPGSGIDVGTVCWNSCYACGESVRITVNLGTSHINVAETGVFIAGGGNFGNPGDFELTDDDGDGVYSIVFERPRNFNSFYTFTNGLCPDYSCKENVAGQDCANPDNFNDRRMGPITQDTIISTCFGLCTTDTNCIPPETSMVTFRVDMREYQGGFVNVYLSGTMNNWAAADNPLNDDDLDDVWETTLELVHGTYEFKFQVDGWTAQEEFAGGEDCTITTGSFVNRIVTIDEDVVLPAYCFNSCEICATNSTRDLQLVGDLFSFLPNPASDQVQILASQALQGAFTLQVYNLAGQSVFQRNYQGPGNYTISTAALPDGFYYLVLRSGQQADVKKLIIQH